MHSKIVLKYYKVFFYCREQIDLTHTDSPRGPSLVGTRVFFCSRDWTLSTSPTSMAFSSFSSFLFHSDSWKYKTVIVSNALAAVEEQEDD